MGKQFFKWMKEYNPELAIEYDSYYSKYRLEKFYVELSSIFFMFSMIPIFSLIAVWDNDWIFLVFGPLMVSFIIGMLIWTDPIWKILYRQNELKNLIKKHWKRSIKQTFSIWIVMCFLIFLLILFVIVCTSIWLIWWFLTS